MSRSNYSDDLDDQWGWICWRGAVASAIKGARGQAFLKEMASAMESLPERKLVANDLEKDGEVCAIGSVGRARGVDMSAIDPEDSETVAALFGISDALAREIVYMNDEGSWRETPEQRYSRMLAWVQKQIRESAA